MLWVHQLLCLVGKGTGFYTCAHLDHYIYNVYAEHLVCDIYNLNTYGVLVY